MWQDWWTVIRLNCAHQLSGVIGYLLYMDRDLFVLLLLCIAQGITPMALPGESYPPLHVDSLENIEEPAPEAGKAMTSGFW